jgi:hypothetical protein
MTLALASFVAIMCAQLAELKAVDGAIEFVYSGHAIKYDGASSIAINGEAHPVSVLRINHYYTRVDT